MPKSPKPKKVEKSLDGKSGAKKKAGKKKLSNSSKSAGTEEIKNAVIEDDKWQCSVVLLVPQTNGLYDFLQQVLANLPENFTVLTRDAVGNTNDKKSQNKSRKGSKTRTSVRSTSKSSKQSSKAAKSKKKSKTGEVKETEHFDESSNDEVESFKVCLELKKLIMELRNTDIAANTKTSITDNKPVTKESEMKNKYIRNRGSGDRGDIKTTVTEEKLIKNENILHRFVILLGFYDPQLPDVLNKQNVSLKAIINVRNSDADENINAYSTERLSTVTAKIKRKTSGKSKKGSSVGKPSNEYSAFLEKFVALSSSSEFLESCKDVTFLNYTVNRLSTKTKEIALQQNTELLELFYKIKEAWDRFKVYTETIHVQNIPTVTESFKLDDAKIYNTMISMVPLECTSTAVILHCMLEQIAWWNEDEKCQSEERDNCLHNDNSTLHNSLEEKKYQSEERDSCLHNNSTLCNSLQDKKFQSEERDSCLHNGNSTLRNSLAASQLFGKNKTPILIHHRDEIKQSTFHLDLPEFDFEQISTNIFMKSPVFKLWEHYPPRSKPERKWFDFQLQKLQNLSDNCISKLDSFFPIYLHHLLMDVLVFKTNQFTNSNHDFANSEQELMKGQKFFSSEKEQELSDSNSELFIRQILYSILCKVPNSSLCQNYAEVFEGFPYVPVETIDSRLNQPIYTNRLRNISSKELPSETLLQKREMHKKKKLDKLVSFLNCAEFVSLYEDFSKLNFLGTNRLEKYGYIEVLNTQTLCQCLQLAFQTFTTINYDYYPVTDSILLWFNNSVQDQVLTTCISKGILETPIGFRDFYCHKLRERTEFGDMTKGEIVSGKSLEEDDDIIVDELKDDQESTDYPSKVEDDEKHFRAEPPNPTIVYDLGSSWMECTESFKNFFSVDSSSVTVKRRTYFNNKEHIVVNVNKNNTFLRYELDPEGFNNFIQLSIDVHQTLHLNCVLKWDIVCQKSSLQRNIAEFLNYFENGRDSKFKLNCSLSITLPSGLFIEVVPTNSIFGPFYVRQRYLGKGPNCSSIWDESFRCYFNNGMVLIFRVDGSVDILYNNGTTVKCHSLELNKLDDLSDTKGNKIQKNTKEDSKEEVDGDLNRGGLHKKKEIKKNQPKKKGNVKADVAKSHSDVDEKETNKQNKKKKDKIKKIPKVTEENKEEKISFVKEANIKPLYKIVEHSVLSWDGELSSYDLTDCTGKKKGLSLRTAFDIINHELYWQRSDGMSGLHTPDNLSIKFPDGNQTTSFTMYNKELWVEKDCIVIYDTSGELVKVESLASTNNAGTGSADFNDEEHLKSAGVDSSEVSLDTNYLQDKGFIYLENSFLMEHTNYASVEYSNEECELKLFLPGNCWVVVDKSGLFSFTSDKNERVILFNDSLLFEANVLSSSTLSKSSTTLRFENVDTVPITFSQTEDSFGNVFSVDERGNTMYLPPVSVEDFHRPRASVYSARFPQKTERFFVFNRDLTGYEMIHEEEQANSLSNEDVKTVSTPVVKDDGELYSVYMQSPIYRSKSEEYVMHDIEDLTPSLIKRKDLLKANKTPEIIWFYPKISSVKKLTETDKINIPQSEQALKAMMIAQRLRVKEKGLNLPSLFSKSLTKYMELNEQIYQKYSNYYPKETQTEEDLIDCEKNRINFLGSKSYYLTDNLPVVITGGVENENEPNKDIFSLFSPSVSKVSI